MTENTGTLTIDPSKAFDTINQRLMDKLTSLEFDKHPFQPKHLYALRINYGIAVVYFVY